MPEEDRFARRVALKVKQEKLHEFLSIIRKDVGPSLIEEKGLRRFFLIRAVDNMNEFVSLTLWNSRREADNYAKSGRYERNLAKIRDMLESEPALSRYHVELHKIGSSVAKSLKRRSGR